MFLLESPWPIVTIGVLAEVILLVTTIVTRRGMYLFVMAGVMAATVLGVVVERLVVTDKERVQSLIYEAAAAVETENHERLKALLTPEAYREVVAYKDGYRFSRVRIHGLRIEMSPGPNPVRAEARFVAVWDYREGSPQLPYRTTALWVVFRKSGDRWLATDDWDFDKEGWKGKARK